jgi:glycopeptide antibiotics resistance protein
MKNNKLNLIIRVFLLIISLVIVNVIFAWGTKNPFNFFDAIISAVCGIALGFIAFEYFIILYFTRKQKQENQENQ